LVGILLSAAIGLGLALVVPTSAMAAGSPQLVVNSVARDAGTGNLKLDLTVSASGVFSSGGVCSTGPSDWCQLSFGLQAADGSTVGGSYWSVPNGDDSPLHEFTLDQATPRVVAIVAIVGGYSQSQSTGWVSLADPYVVPALSVAVHSAGRDANNDFAYDVGATEISEYTAAGGCSQSSYPCNWSLIFQAEDGSEYMSGYVLVPAGVSPYSYSWVGAIAEATSPIISVAIYISGGGGQAESDFVPVHDPLIPSYLSGSVGLAVGSFGRDSASGGFNYDVTATTDVVDAGCASGWYHCTILLDVKDENGEIHGLDGATSQLNAATSSAHFAGSGTLMYGAHSYPLVVALRARVYDGGLGEGRVGSWISVSDTPLTATSTMSIKSLKSDQHQVWYDVTTSSANLVAGHICDTSYWDACTLRLQTRDADGQVHDTIDSFAHLGMSSSPVAHEFIGTYTNGSSDAAPTAIRTVVTGVFGTVLGTWQPIRNVDPANLRGGSNASQKGCACTSGDPINTETGEYYDTVGDLSLAGVGPAVGISRTYSSTTSGVDGPFGFGWNASFASRLVVDEAGEGGDPPRAVHVEQENGATVPFLESSGGSYTSDAWTLATLARAGDGSWTLKRTKGSVDKLKFNSDGQLISQTDLSGNTVQIHYSSGHVSSITGSGGREIDLTWASGRVSSLEDSAGRTTSYSYDTSGNLTQVTAVDGGIWKYSYDPSHLLLTRTKPDGGVLANVYDGAARVQQQTDEVGRVTQFAYSGYTTTVTLPDGSVNVSTYNQGQLSSLTTASGTALAATTSYLYSAAGDQVSVTDPLGHVTASTFDGAGNPLTTTDPAGKVTTRTFNSLDEPLTVQDSLGRTTTNTYDSAGNLLTSTTPGSHTTTLTYNGDGTVATATDPRGKVTSYTYDSAGRPLCVTDPDSRQTCQSYDARGFATSKSDAAGKVTHLTYDDAGRVLTSTDPNSHTTTTRYDGDGNAVSVEDPSGHITTAAFDGADQRTSATDGRGKTTTYTYAPRGSVATVTDPNGHVTTNSYDLQNRLSSTTDADSRATSYTYDLAGEKLSTTLPAGGVTSSTYDADGRVATSTDARGKVTSYGYDDAGELTSTTDPLSRVTHYSYTDDGKLHVVTLPDSSTETYGYNAADVQTSFQNADGETTTSAFDDAGLLTSETQPGSMTTSYSYDAAGRLHTVTTPDGTVQTRSYDDDGRLTGLDYPGSSSDVSYTYYADGARHTMTDVTGTTTYTYNQDIALISVQNGNGQTVGYGYDDAGQLTSLTYPGSRTVGYGYDDAGNLSSVRDWASRTTTLTTTADGLLHTRTDPSGVTETRSYDSADNINDIVTATSSATLADYMYGYDDAGQLTSSTLTDGLHTTTATQSWGYDQTGQLAATSPTTGYTATPAGKITATPDGQTLAYNAKQQLATAGTSTSSTAYSYDGNGNRTTATSTAGSTTWTAGSYSYNADGDLTSVTTAGTTVTYTPDGDGLRQSRTTGTATAHMVWDTSRAIPLLLDDGTHSYIYAIGATPIAQTDDTTGAITYLHADNVGSVRTLTDAAGAVTGIANYSPYGTRNTSGAASDIGYTGAWTDPTTGLDYLRARDYDPTTSQFVQVDPAIDHTHQPYTYAANNPLTSIDPTGLCVGMDGTPQDRPCTQNDFFWAGLGDHIAAEADVASAGFDNGALAGIPDALGWTCSSAKSDDLYWTEYAIGGVVMTAATYGVGEGVIEGVRGAMAARQLALDAAAAAARAEVDALVSTGARASKGDLTVAGRELQKHFGDNPNFPVPSGSPANINAQGQNVLRNILDDSGTITRPITQGNFKGGTYYIAPNGTGAAFDSHNVFQYFGDFKR
jgi:RHS repeat-associated protein